MRSRRGKQGAPPCESYDQNGDLTVHHQWHARNVHGFIIRWYVCEFCGMSMHSLRTADNPKYPDYEFIPAYVIEEMSYERLLADHHGSARELERR